jgi:hypothetical protein
MDIHDEIEKEAYYLYEKSGCICSRDFDNWLEAERMVLARYAAKEAPNPLSAEEQMTVPKSASVFAEEGVVEEIVSSEVKPAKKITTRKTAAKPKKEVVKKRNQKDGKINSKEKERIRNERSLSLRKDTR